MKLTHAKCTESGIVFYLKTALNPDRVVELDLIVRDAVDLKCMVAQLRKSIKRVDPYFSALSMTIEKYTF